MNVWTEFQKLIKTTNRWIGLVQSINASSNKIVVQIPGTVKTVEVDGPNSEYTIGDYVFIENTTITGKATNLRAVATEEIF